jgi:hypothetical protein
MVEWAPEALRPAWKESLKLPPNVMLVTTAIVVISLPVHWAHLPFQVIPLISSAQMLFLIGDVERELLLR